MNALELLMAAPDSQVKRCQLAYNAIAAGNWADAEHYLGNASAEETGEWAKAAGELADYCAKQNAKSFLG